MKGEKAKVLSATGAVAGHSAGIRGHLNKSMGTIVLAFALQASAQMLHSNGPLPSFEVATVKPWKPSAAPPRVTAPVQKLVPVGEPEQISNRVHFIGQTELLIASAFDLPVDSGRILRGPDWISREDDRYEVQAKIDDARYGAMMKMTLAQQRAEVQRMEQGLLADRFKLKVHFETREMPVLELIVAKGTPKLRPAKMGEGSALSVVGSESGSEMRAYATTIEEFVRSPFLSTQRLMIVDRSGLKGRYDFTLRWRTDDLGDAPDGQSSAAVWPPLVTALPEQLGLKLVAARAPVEVLVIDHIERPSEN